MVIVVGNEMREMQPKMKVQRKCKDPRQQQENDSDTNI